MRGLLGLQGMQAIRGPEFCRDLQLVLPLLADPDAPAALSFSIETNRRPLATVGVASAP